MGAIPDGNLFDQISNAHVGNHIQQWATKDATR